MIYPFLSYEINSFKHLILILLPFVLFFLIVLIDLKLPALAKNISAQEEKDRVKYKYRSDYQENLYPLVIWALGVGAIIYLCVTSFITSYLNEHYAHGPVAVITTTVTDKALIYVRKSRRNFKITVHNNSCAISNSYCSFSLNANQNLFYQVRVGTSLQLYLYKGWMYGTFIRQVKILR